MAEAVGLTINVGKTKNIGVKCRKFGASVPIAQKNVEVLTGNRKNRFGTLIEVENQLTVRSDERSVVADQVSTANNRSSAVSDDESFVCSGCKRRFDTARGCKVHEARFCKSKNSKSVEDSASKILGL